MLFDVLGPLRVTGDDGAPVPISRPRVRNLLALLLLQANRPVPSDALAEALYEPGRRLGGSALRTHIWWLRSDLAPARRVLTVPGGYRIEVHPGELDLDRFRELADAGHGYLDGGDYGNAAELLGQAAGLWRDPPLSDLPPSTDMTQVIEPLLDERRIVEELLTDARLALGDHRHMLGVLRARVAADPQDERACGQLLRALYLSGRKHEAFEAYARLRKVLANGYGASPGPGLQRLYQQILQEDPQLGPVPAPGAQASGRELPVTVARRCHLPPTSAHFDRREGELRAITDVLGHRGDARGPARVVALTGPAQSGKTALAVQAAHELRPNFPGGQWFVELGDPSRQVGDVLADLLRCLGTPPGQIPHTTSGRSRLWRSMTTDRGVLLVLDNVIAAAQVPPLLPRGGSCGVIVTARSPLHGLHLTRRIELAALSLAEVTS
jgi:DNA-binding SARP family transcriptional activator